MTSCQAEIFIDDSLSSTTICCNQELHDVGLHTANLYNPSAALGITRIYWNDPEVLEINKDSMLAAGIPVTDLEDEEFFEA